MNPHTVSSQKFINWGDWLDYMGHPPPDLNTLSHLHPFSQRVVQIIREIPQGKVQTYGGIARLAGNPRGARQVTRLLHSLSSKYGLPWHRVVNSRGEISLPEAGQLEQRALLEAEGVEFSSNGKISLKKYLWPGDTWA